ncbi:MAG: NADH-quinone oxidoreductase subunit A [Planctomycetes bacterium]|jgi:NADH-quinone oxidoreductase subunit A|nr:NADH-quinone oxidoreductase subunit A [Planctomycetota bacterium]
MLRDYFPILVIAAVVVGFIAFHLIASELLGRRRRTRGKGRINECGVTPYGSARGRFSVKFFLVAVLFILFDIAIVFLIPWAVSLRQLTELGHGDFLLAEMAGFIVILGLGLAYAWRKGGLEWE